MRTFYERSFGLATVQTGEDFCVLAPDGWDLALVCVPEAAAANILIINDMNADRAAQENLAALALPTKWSTLTPAERIFVATNLERANRGEAAIPNLVNTYDRREEITFRLIVDGPLPASVVRTAPSLKMELDQVSTASRSADTLCYDKVTLHLKK
jgi:hypothetical protein